MDWQEIVVAAIVGGAAFRLYRHLRGVFAPARSGGGSCHGCSGCAIDETGGPGASRREGDKAAVLR